MNEILAVIIIGTTTIVGIVVVAVVKMILDHRNK